MGERPCSLCGEVKPPEAFHYRDRQLGTRRADCKACQLAQQRRWWAENRAATAPRFDPAKVMAEGARLCRMNGQRPSVRNLARTLGVSTNTVTRWRNGSTKYASLTVADRVAIRAGVYIEELAA